MGVMSLAEIMDRSIEILRKHIKTILLFSLAYGVIFIGLIIISVIVGSILVGIAFTASLGPVVIGIIFSLFALMIVAFSLALNIGMIKISSQEFLEERVYVDNALKATFKSLFKVLGIVVALTILFLPVIGIFAAIIYFLYTRIQISMIPFGTYGTTEVILIIISIIIIIIAAIVAVLAYITLFIFSLQVIVIENTGVIKALKRSYKLVRNNYWRMFGYIILFNITIYAIKVSLESFLALASSIVYLFAKFLNVGQDYKSFITKALTDFQWPLNLLSLLVITPIGTIMITLLYFNQRFKKEGYDIALNLDKIQKNEERKQLSEIV
jgi:hypothetical protein